MKVNLHNVGFTVDQKLVDFIQKKMDKLDLFYDRVIDADVYLKLDNTTAKENKIRKIGVKKPVVNDSKKNETKKNETKKRRFYDYSLIFIILFLLVMGLIFCEEGVDACENPIERFLKKYKETR